MLTETELRKIADYILDRIPQAHRGAVPLAGMTVIAFGNDGHLGTPKGEAAVAKTRTVLAVDGFTLGPVVASSDGYTWVFEGESPADANFIDKVEAVEEAVWEGWHATRSVAGTPAEADELGRHQRQIASDACFAFSADAALED